MIPSQKKANEYTMKECELPGPYKIWLQNPNLIEVMAPVGAYYRGHSSLSKAEIEIATNPRRRDRGPRRHLLPPARRQRSEV